MLETKSTKFIILASQSPRRVEILKKAQYFFVSFPVSISEIPNENLSLDEQILDIARRKATESARLYPDRNQDAVILACDTMVCYQNKAIGKPENELDAFNTLKKLSGQKHEVKTALILIDLKNSHEVSHVETSEVFFKKFSDQEIKDYISTGEPMDKAGSYAIQGIGKKLVEKFIGDYDNVVGLPLAALENIFKKQNWTFQKNEKKSTDNVSHESSEKISDRINGFEKSSDRTHESSEKNLSFYKKQLSPNQNILAVSKLQPIEKITALYNDGQKHFGENYIQEALEKIEKLKDHEIIWHLIGPIQKNKVKYLKNNFKYIHSVDSLQLAELIHQKAKDINHVQKIFIQVNLAAQLTSEVFKHGFDQNQFEQSWDELKKLNHLEIVGLMTMPPLQNEPEDNRTYFKKLVELGQRYQLSQFSMGTSHDYKIALEENATWIRLGTVLFGERQKVK